MIQNIKSICVYSSSSNSIDPVFFQDASELGRLIAEGGYKMVFGAGCVGLMGECARAFHKSGGQMVGVIPEFMRVPGICYEEADELIVTETMRERKATMESYADAFIALPGGFGTLEELTEIITLKQLRIHNKPIVVLNTNHYYDPLADMFNRLFQMKFTKEEYRIIYHVANTPKEAMDYIANYAPVDAEPAGKWDR